MALVAWKRVARLFLPVAALLPLAATGCIVLPFATPPVRGSAAFRVYVPKVPAGQQVAFSGQVGINPLQLAPNLIARRVDFGVGYVGSTNDKYYYHGAYAEVSAFPWVRKLGKGNVARASITLQPTFLVDSRSAPGAGGGAQVGLEILTFAKGPFDSNGHKSGYVGYAYGEGGIGFQLEGFGARVLDSTGGATYFSVGAAIVVRLPASVGILWAVK